MNKPGEKTVEEYWRYQRDTLQPDGTAVGSFYGGYLR